MILKPEAESVLVYAKADRSISLVPTAVVRRQSERSGILSKGTVDRAPWKRSLNIEIPATASSEPSNAPTTEKTSSSDPILTPQVDDNVLYTSVVVYDCIAKHMTWKRLTGHVKEWQVVDHPIV